MANAFDGSGIERPDALDGVASAHQQGQTAERGLSLSEAMAKGRPNPLLISRLWNMHEHGAQRAEMLEGERYYHNHGDIENKKRTLIGEGGNVEEYKEGVLSNSKIRHPDFRTFVRQKVTYLMSKPFSIQCKDEALRKTLEGYFTEGVRATIRNLTKKVVCAGRAPLEVYYTKEGELRVRCLRPENVVPYWADDERKTLLAALRRWEEDVVQPDYSIKRVVRFDFYNADGVWHYVVADDGSVAVDVAMGSDGWDANFYSNVPVTDGKGNVVLTTDPTTGQPTPSTELVGSVFSRLPILFAKYNDDEMGLLNFVKSMVDAYDTDVSDIDDQLRDVPNSVKVIRGYNGENLGELVHNLRLFRAVSVQSDGGVEEVGRDLDTQAAENHLTRLRKDMYSAASCVDTTRVDNLGNQSGVAMRYIYSDLDMDCMELWMDLEEQVLKPLSKFFLYDHYARTGQTFADQNVDFVPNTDIAINETETITNIKNSVGIISEETLVANHPYVTDVTTELGRIRKEREDALSLMGGDALGLLGGTKSQPKQITSRKNGEKGN